MAETILYNVVAEIVTKLGSEAFTQARLWSEAEEEFEKLRNTASVLQAVLADAERGGVDSNQINELLRQMREIVYEVDDLLDDITVHTLNSRKVCFRLSNPFLFLNGFNLLNRMKSLRKRLQAIAENKRLLLPIRPPQVPIVPTPSHSSIPEIVVGRKDDKMAIIKLLTSPTYNANVAVIPIVGIGGQGKTTLAQLAYNDEVVTNWFMQRIWVWVSVNFDVKSIVEKILESVTRKKQKDLKMDPLKDLLHEQVNGKRYLIVLDDVWCEDFDRWSGLMDLLRGGAQGSRILVRYIDFSDNQDLKKLPESLTELRYLQTLKLDRCSSLVELPKGTGRMRSLTRLGLDGCDSLTHMPSGLGKLTSLCSLSRFVVADDAKRSNSKSKGALKELGGLNRLKGSLDIMNLQCVKTETECKAVNLKEKCRLQSVLLHWKRENRGVDGSESMDEQTLEALQPHKDLKEYKILGFGGNKFPSWIASLDNLTSVTLFNCRNLQDLPPLHSLPNLKQLIMESLEALEFVEKVSCSTSNGTIFFPSLIKLQIWKCPSLKGWWNPDSWRDWRFPLLAELTIGYCPNMTSLPLFQPLKSIALWDTDAKSLESMVSGESLEEQQLQYLQIGIMKDLYRIHENIFPKLAALKTLAVADCPQLLTLDDALRCMPRLEELWIWGCPNLDISEENTCVDSAEWSGPTGLRYVFLRDIPKLKSLPRWMAFNLTLQDLRIWDCSSLVQPPPWMASLRALRLLDVYRCSPLSQCLRTSRIHQDNIAHISNIKIDGRFFQFDGVFKPFYNAVLARQNTSLKRLRVEGYKESGRD